MGFFEGLYSFLMNASEKMEREMDRKVTKNFNEATRRFDDENPESIKAFTNARENLEEFQRQKANLDQQRAELKFRHDTEKAMQYGDSYGFERATHEYNKAIDRANYEQQKIEKMKHEADVRIQKEYEFYHKTLPNIVAGIELTKSVISSAFSKNNDNHDEASENFEKLLSLYYARTTNQDIDYFENVKKQEEVIHKVQSGKMDLLTNQTRRL